MDPPPADLDAAYRRYRRLLFGVLKVLGERGLRMEFDEGLDVVHDFFLDEYPALRTRYDPARGQFETLLFAAFRRFATRRLVQMRRHREILRSLHSADSARSEESAPAAIDLLRLHGHLAELPTDARELLMAHLGQAHSERVLARRFGWSRYEVRSRLVAALGQLAESMGVDLGVDAHDWQVARAVWQDERSRDDVAAAFGLTPEQVRRATERVTAAVTAVLRSGVSR